MNKNKVQPVVKQNKNLDFIIPGILVLFTFFLYLHSLKNGFVEWDDQEYIKNNVVIHHLSWVHIKTIFTSFYSFNYHPLTTLTWAFEYAIAGDKSAALYHFDNLLLHLINIILVYWFIKLLSRNTMIAMITAFWFGVHPMHVESVAWVSERKDLLYGGFFIAALIAWYYYMQASENLSNDHPSKPGKKTRYYLVAFLLFLLSLLSKSAAVVFPVILFLLDWLVKRKFTLKMVVEKIPFFLMALVFGIVAILSQKTAMQSNANEWFSPLNRFFVINYAIFRYLSMLFFPSGMSTLHPFPLFFTGKFVDMMVYISPLINLLIFGVVIFSIRYTRRYLFGLMFFLITIILVLQILAVGGAYMAERYTYIPYIGLLYIFALIFVEFWKKSGNQAVLRSFLAIIFVGFSIFFTIGSWNRIKVWHDTTSLWTDVINKYPLDYHAYSFRGTARKNDGDQQGAFDDFNKTLFLHPNDASILNNRGNIYFNRHQYTEAFKDYNTALGMDSTIAVAFNNRGAIKGMNGDIKGAIKDFSRAISLDPGYIDGYRNRGYTFLQMNDPDAARADWTKAVSLGDKTSEEMLKKYFK
ncbi:MAG: hypothetical protein NTX61_06835 [Bacteroidetes bacterium]|nr:hypothetical protein [Bacteroidota bacterium]